jgi:hypothetical protein
VPFKKEGSYICLPSESNDANLLDEPLKGFIVKPVYPLGPCKPRAFGITTHSESVQILQSIKLVYQPCSRTRAALGILKE